MKIRLRNLRYIIHKTLSENVSAEERFFNGLASLGLIEKLDRGDGRYIYIDPKTRRSYNFLFSGQTVEKMSVGAEHWSGFEKRWPITSKYAGRPLSGSRTTDETLAWISNDLTRARKGSNEQYAAFKQWNPDGDILDYVWWIDHKFSEFAPADLRQQVSDVTGYEKIETAEDAIDASKMMKTDQLIGLASKMIKAVSSFKRLQVNSTSAT